MLQSTPLSKVYGHSHFKKFWLMQNQKETENKALLAPSPSRNNGNSSGLGHESKQGSQFSVGNTNTRTLTTPPGLPVRHLVSGPACFNMARHTSLVTCAESLSPPSRLEQSRSLVRPSSPNNSSSSLKEEKHCLVVDGNGMSVNSPCRQDTNSVYTSQWDSSFGFGDQLLVGDFTSPRVPKEEIIENAMDDCFSSKDPRLSSDSVQEGYQHGKIPDDFTISSGPSKCGVGFFSELETVTPFAVPFQLPEKYFLEAEAKMFDGAPAEKIAVLKTSSGTLHPIKSAVPSISHGRGELLGAVEGEVRRNEAPCSTVSRTCTVCGTSKTPLWRSGPQGPKSLCNACGIRFKKARRGSSDSADCAPLSQTSPSAKSSLKAVKRKQDTPFINVDTHLSKSSLTNGAAATQAVKKRRWSQLVRKDENVAQKGELTGSSNESSLTWNLHSPSAVSSPSVSHFERLSIDENSAALNLVAGKDEEAAAMLLMYMSCGLVFA
ncbi:hypothetical protein GOP47_0026526 [Adiantum capillus-veneris]|nr:hypothetical protein GOP47_0026526 [Adiantum capillus-veneris]